MVSAVIVAGGKGVRMGAGMNKVFLPLCGKEIISRTISAFEKCPEIDEIIIVTSAADTDTMKKIIKRDGFGKVTHITEGGAVRRESVYNGLKLASGDITLIHDGARCLVSQTEITDVIRDTKAYGAAAVGVTVKDTLKKIDNDGNIVATIDREKTAQIQTPQGFQTAQILKLHDMAAQDNIDATDDCSIFEHYQKSVHFTPGSYDNIKITTPEDLEVGENILRRKGL